MNPHAHVYYVNMESGVATHKMSEPLVGGSVNADQFVIYLQECGRNVDLENLTATGFAKRADGQVVPLEGVIDDGAIRITLDKYCYAVPGQLQFGARVSGDNIVRTVLTVSMTVTDGDSGVIVDNGTLGTLSELIAAIDHLNNVKNESEGSAILAAAAAEEAVKAKNDTIEIRDKFLEDMPNIPGSAEDSAPPIITTSSGTTAAPRDLVSGRKFRGMNIYGHSTRTESPAPNAPVDITSQGDNGSFVLTLTGRNIFDHTKVTSASGVANATFTVSDDGWIDVTSQKKYDYLSNTLYLSAGVTYALHFEVEIYDRPEDSTAPTYIAINFGSNPVTTEITANGTYDYKGHFTPPANGFYTLHTDANRGSDEPAKMRCRVTMVVGSYTSATMPEWTPYESEQITLPYTLRGVPATSGGNYTDSDGNQWITDEIDFSRGVHVQRVKEIVLTGTETWTKASGYNIYINTSKMSGLIANQAYVTSLSSHFVMTAYVSYARMEDGTAYFMPNPQMRMRNNACATVNEWKSYLAEQYSSGSPVTVYAAMSDPLETPLDASLVSEYNALRTREGMTLTAEGAFVKVSYVADTKAYVDSHAGSGSGGDASYAENAGYAEEAGNAHTVMGVDVVSRMIAMDDQISENAANIVDLVDGKADKAYMVSLFEQLKDLILAGNTSGAVALLDQAILDQAILA